MQIVMYFHMQNIPSYLTVQSCWPNLFHCLQMELVFELACISMHTVLHDAQRDREIELSWFPDHSHLQPLITCIFAYCNWSKTWGRNVLRTRLKLSIIPWNNLSACDSWLLNQYSVFRKIHLHSIGNARSFSRCMIIPLLGPMPSNCTIVYTHDGMLKSYKGFSVTNKKVNNFL